MSSKSPKSDDERTRVWQKLAPLEAPADPIQTLRSCIAQIRVSPLDPEARRVSV